MLNNNNLLIENNPKEIAVFIILTLLTDPSFWLLWRTLHQWESGGWCRVSAQWTLHPISWRRTVRAGPAPSEHPRSVTRPAVICSEAVRPVTGSGAVTLSQQWQGSAGSIVRDKSDKLWRELTLGDPAHSSSQPLSAVTVSVGSLGRVLIIFQLCYG